MSPVDSLASKVTRSPTCACVAPTAIAIGGMAGGEGRVRKGDGDGPGEGVPRIAVVPRARRERQGVLRVRTERIVGDRDDIDVPKTNRPGEDERPDRGREGECGLEGCPVYGLRPYEGNAAGRRVAGVLVRGDARKERGRRRVNRERRADANLRVSDGVRHRHPRGDVRDIHPRQRPRVRGGTHLHNETCLNAEPRRAPVGRVREGHVEDAVVGVRRRPRKFVNAAARPVLPPNQGDPVDCRSTSGCERPCKRDEGVSGFRVVRQGRAHRGIVGGARLHA